MTEVLGKVHFLQRMQQLIIVNLLLQWQLEILLGDISGVAPDADLVLSSIPNFEGTYSTDDFARDLNSARALGAVASNNSWVLADNTNGNANANRNVTEMEALIASLPSLTTDQVFGFVANGDASVPDEQTTAWTDYVTAMDNFQNSGIMIWANGNYNEESDASVLGGLPEFYPQLAEAWITVNLSDFTGTSLSSAKESDFTLVGNKCGSAKKYCLTADGFDLKGASWVNTGISQYTTGSGSSYSAPMIAGGLSLIHI